MLPAVFVPWHKAWICSPHHVFIKIDTSTKHALLNYNAIKSINE